MASFHFELVSPDKLMFSGRAESVLVPGSEGDFVVLPGHAPVMASLRPGVVAIKDARGKRTRFGRSAALRTAFSSFRTGTIAAPTVLCSRVPMPAGGLACRARRG